MLTTEAMISETPQEARAPVIPDMGGTCEKVLIDRSATFLLNNENTSENEA